jgi:hypothetical protein
VEKFSLTQEALYVETLRQEWLAVRNAVQRLVQECSAKKMTPPNNYWQAARKAEKRFMMALQVLTVLEGT